MRRLIAWLDRGGFVAVGVGQAITVLWLGKPIFIRHRTAEEIKKAQDVPVSELKDPYAQVSGAPSDLSATDANRTKPGKDQWLVAIGMCTHLGCVPKGQAATDDRGLYGGWFCPCPVRCTTRLAASAKVLRRATSTFRPTSSPATRRSRSANTHRHKSRRLCPSPFLLARKKYL